MNNFLEKKKNPTQFNRLPYYKDLSIMHLFDAMHIGKNVIETLWKILDGRHDKENLVKTCNDIDESNHALKFFIESNRDKNHINTSVIPWLLTQQQTDAIYEAIKRTIFPTGFSTNISSLMSKKGDFG